MQKRQQMSLIKKYRDLIANGGWVMGLNLGRQVLSLVFVMVLVRVLSKDTFGHYQFVVAAIGFFGISTLPGIQSAIVQSVARGFDGTYRESVHIVLLWSLLGSVCLLALAVQQELAGERNTALALSIAAVLFPFAHGIINWTSYQAGKELFRQTSIYQGLGYAASYLGGMAAVLFIDPGFVLVVLITNAVLAVQNLWVTSRHLDRIDAKAPVEEGAIRYGLNASFAQVFNVTGNYIDKFLLFYLLAPEALAVYVIAERIPELLKKYMQSARQVLVPGFSRKARYTRKLDRQLNRAGLVISAGVLVIVFGVVPWAMPLLFTSAYEESVLYCQLLLGTLLVGQAATVKFTFIVSRLDARSFRGVTIGTNLVRVTASLALVPFFGIWGAIGATALYRLSTVLLVSYYIRKFHFVEDKDE